MTDFESNFRIVLMVEGFNDVENQKRQKINIIEWKRKKKERKEVRWLKR